MRMKRNLPNHNDILIQASYNFDQYKNLIKSNIPFVVLEGKVSDDDSLSIELSRESAEIGIDISKSITRTIYTNEIGKIINYIGKNQGKVHGIRMQQEINTMVSRRIMLPKLLLRKNEIFIANSNMLNKIGDKCDKYLIRSNSTLEGCINFNDDDYFILENLYVSKANIANLINNVKLISTNFLFKYIVNASNSSNGFRMEALKVIMKDIFPAEDWDIGYRDLWDKISSNRTEIKKAFINKSKYGVYCFGEFDTRLIEKIFNSRIEGRDILVSKILDNSSLTNSYDKLFNKLYCRGMRK